MTTLVGVKAEKDYKSVILGSDMSRTQTSWQPQGDVAYRQQRRTEGQKIYVNDSGTAAWCMSGIYDNPYINFLADFLENKFDLEKITKEGYFSEFAGLNISRWEGRVPNNEIVNGLLLATNFDEPRLYTCWPLGKVEERSWTSIGSGSDYALNYISEQEKIIPKRITASDGIDLVINSLDKASQDLYTGGLDLIVLDGEGIHDLGKKIRSDLDSARIKAIENSKKIHGFI